MTVTSLAATSMTDFILAGEACFLSGMFFSRPKAPRSEAWYWQFSLLFLALSALIGGLNHGFIEPFGQSVAYRAMTLFNWFLIGLITLCTLLCIAEQFFTQPWRRYVTVVAFIQLLLYSLLLLKIDNFLLVILNYAPVLLLLLACNLRRGGDRNGSAAMSIGIIVTFIASGVQAAGFDRFSPLDSNCLYHLGIMIALVFFYYGGLHLQGLIPAKV